MHIQAKTIVGFCVITGVHYVLTIGSLLFSFGVSMDRFDSARPASILEKMMSGTTSILSFPTLPLLKYLPVSFSGLWGHLPFLANSALWAFLILVFVARARKKPPNQTSTAQRP